jgi:hypothetical protein
MVQIRLIENEYSYAIPKLRKWAKLQSIHEEISSAADKGNLIEMANNIAKYISYALDISVSILDDVPWIEAARAFYDIHQENVPNEKFKILVPAKDIKKVSFDYDDRPWYVWVDTLASRYGWSIEYIADLEVESAIALLQEIDYTEQLKREWDWSLSELAYPYNEHIKKSEFKPMPRPEWMQDHIEYKEPEKLKIRKDLLPVGNIIRYGQPTDT